jgi:hypothetical protein
MRYDQIKLPVQTDSLISIWPAQHRAFYLIRTGKLFSARESEALLYVARKRVNLLLTSSPAALQIDPLSGSGDFAPMISRGESFITVKI